MQVIINGFVMGIGIAMMSLSFILVYVPTKVFHIALGGIYALVPYIAWLCMKNGLPWYICTAFAMLIGVCVSFMCEILNHSILDKKKVTPTAHLVSSLGIYIILVQTIALVWGNDTKVLREGINQVFRIGDLIIARTQLYTLAISTLVLCIFYTWFWFSKIGLRFRALADNPVELSLRGLNIKRLRFVAFGLSGLICSISALITAYDTGFEPHGGLSVLLIALVAMIIGGRKSFIGPIIAGIILGIIRSSVSWFFSANWQDAITFLLLAVFLLMRPNGIFQAKKRLESMP